jgi:hypothetical protein
MVCPLPQSDRDVSLYGAKMASYAGLVILLVITLVTGRAVGAEAPKAGPEIALRLGGQVVEGSPPWPALGLYVSMRVAGDLRAGLGWEPVRIYPGWLATSGDLVVGPILIGALRGVVWRRSGAATGVYRMIGVAAGVALPQLAFEAVPSDEETGILVEGALDLSAGCSGENLTIAGYLSPGWAYGTIRNPETERMGIKSRGGKINALTVQMGLVMGVRF